MQIWLRNAAAPIYGCLILLIRSKWWVCPFWGGGVVGGGWLGGKLDADGVRWRRMQYGVDGLLDARIIAYDYVIGIDEFVF